MVGDFKSEAALSKIKNYFESIPSQPAPAAVDTVEPEQKAERRFTVEDPLARLPQIIIGFKGIVGNTPDAYAMQVLNQTLATGQSSRLYQKLVKEKELVSGVFGFLNAMRGNGDYQITATLAPGKKIEDVEAVINEEIARLLHEPIADWELAKAKNSQRRAAIQGLQNSLGEAIRLTTFAVFNNDPNLINTQFDKIEAISKEDVQRVANKYLKVTNRTVGITIPKPRGSVTAGSTN
jgi:predicted Zn-dependent peptidase